MTSHDERLDEGDPEEQVRNEQWRLILTGEDKGLPRMRRVLGAIPSSPRCKLCATPFGGAGKVLTRVINHGRADVNPLLCSACFSSLGKQLGGAEVAISVLFADVRGSTGIAERTSPA